MTRMDSNAVACGYGRAYDKDAIVCVVIAMKSAALSMNKVPSASARREANVFKAGASKRVAMTPSSTT